MSQCCPSCQVELDRETNTVRSLGDARVWVDPLGRPCPEDAGEPVYHEPTGCVTDGVYWWHREGDASHQAVVDRDEQPCP